MHATTVAVDLARSVFQLAVADDQWRVVETQRLTRTQFERWLVNRSVGLVIMEACGSAYHWGRWLGGLGIEVSNRIPPTPRYADNSSGSLPAACSVWRCDDADSMSARDNDDPTTDAGYTTAGALPSGPESIRLLLLWGSPYTNS